MTNQITPITGQTPVSPDFQHHICSNTNCKAQTNHTHPHTKIFATLSLAAATGKKIHNIGIKDHDKKAQRFGRNLQLAGKYATRRYPSDGFAPEKIRAVYDSVTSLISGPTAPPEILSMIIAGISDISVKADKKRKDLLLMVIKAAQKCLDTYPDNGIDHEAAFDRYMRWANES